ncbi:MAG: biopolymer transporter ExbD [Rhodobiaceae bacterium]|nr:biopolymer transporter ExbD [Rhodobiaceae bacterium]
MKTLRARTTGYKPDGTLPLINIVLLLVLAFMMAGTFAETLQPEFDPLRSEAEAPREEVVQTVVLTMDAEGALSREGINLTSDDLGALLGVLGRGDDVLEVRADARSPAVRVITLLRSVEGAGIQHVQIVTLARK